MPQSLPLDPLQWYLKYPAFFDFLIFWILFGLLIRTALINAKKLKKHGNGWPSYSETGKKSTEQKLESGIAVIVGLALALSVMAYGKLSLRSLFSSGLLPAFLGLFAGFIAYSGFSSHFKTEKEGEISVTAILSSFFVGVIVFSLLNYKPGGDAISSLIFMFVIILLVYLLVTKGNLGKHDAARDSDTTLRDLDTSTTTSNKFTEDAEKARKAAEKASKERPTIKQRFSDGLNSVRRFKNLFSNSLNKRRLLEAAFAAALLLLPTHSPGQIKSELSKKYPAGVVESVMRSLPKKQFTESALPGTAEKPVETVEEIPVPPEDVGQIVENIEEVKVNCNAQVQITQLRINEFDELMKSIDILPADYAKLKSEMLKLESDVNTLLNDADGILKDAQNTANSQLINDAELARESVFGIKETVVAENAKFKADAEAKTPILRSDEAALNRISQQLKQRLSELREINKELVSSSADLKGKASWAEINLFYNVVNRYESLIAVIMQLFENEAGTPETLAEILRSIEQRIEEYRKFLSLSVESIGKYRVAITEVQTKLTEMTKAKETEKKAEVEEFADINGIISKAKEVFDVIRAVQRANLDDATVFEGFRDVLINFSQKTTALATLMTTELGKIKKIPAASGSPEEKLIDLITIKKGTKMSSLISYAGQLANSYDAAKTNNNNSKLKASIANLNDFPALLDVFIQQLNVIQQDISKKIA